jgi:hypothetical protein
LMCREGTMCRWHLHMHALWWAVHHVYTALKSPHGMRTRYCEILQQFRVFISHM